MELKNVKVNACFSKLTELTDPALFNSKQLMNSLRFVEDTIGSDVYNSLLFGFQMLHSDVDILSDDKITNQYLLLDQTKFKHFTIVLKSLMGDKYEILKEKYQFDVHPLDIKLNF